MNSRICCIACGVFRTDLDAMRNAGEIDADVTYLPGGLHTEPERLNRELKDAISRAEGRAPEGGWNRIILLYGLCGQGLTGIGSLSAPLAVPRVHDCISLFMGGAEAYRKQFAKAPGTYYISAGWFQEQVEEAGEDHWIRYPALCMGDNDETGLKKKFGKENADAVHRFLDSWKDNYSRCVYLDTGSPEEARYRQYAEKIAGENNWEFEILKGSRSLIRRCFDADDSGGDVLVIPPGHTIYHDPASGTFDSGPAGRDEQDDSTRTITIPGRPKAGGGNQRIGLGIDAGGTNTDAVVFDFESGAVRAKAKAPTTHWRYSVGIEQAVRRLPPQFLEAVDLVSVSTTLVTNAIVENNRKPVGLLIMPSGGLPPENLPDAPVSILRGRMTIGGDVTEPVDEQEVRTVAAEMAARYRLQAFAVSGYGGASNPELEIQVRDIVRDETGLPTCCGHEMSGRLNFSVRAGTAVLNAGTIPIMEDFLAEMDFSLDNLGIRAPMLVVRGDGTVMARDFARSFPVQAALSGPAASMAGAMFLTGHRDAVVIDVGGTTSDIGLLEKGKVAIRKDGARIGGWATHVEAVDMLTIGLGGDSEIVYESGEWILGPRRVAPLCRLFDDIRDENRTALLGLLRDVENGALFRRESSRSFQVLARTGRKPDFTLSTREQAVWNALETGPASLHRIAAVTGLVSWKLLHTRRLESAGCLVRHGLTPTDLFLIDGRIETDTVGRDSELAGAAAGAVCAAAGIGLPELHELVSERTVSNLGRGLLERLIEDVVDEPVLSEAILDHGNSFLELRPRLRKPLVALGAPAGLMVSDATRQFEADPVLCDDGDVANAIGAITSRISISRKASVVPRADGSFRIRGLDSPAPTFDSLEESEGCCMELLTRAVRARARDAGTSEDEVNVTIETDVARTEEGSRLFVGRHYTAVVTGSPDLA